MQVRNDALAGVLARAQRTGSLPPIFVVASDEALLSLEAQDAIRATARGMGYSERDVLNVDARFDWSKLAESAQALSLFAEKKIVEVVRRTPRDVVDEVLVIDDRGTDRSADERHVEGVT